MKKLFKKFAGLMMGLLAVAGLAGIGANSNEAPVKAEAIEQGKCVLKLNSSYWGEASAYYTIHYWGGETSTSWPGKKFNGGSSAKGNAEITADYDITSTNCIIVRWGNSGCTTEWNRWNYFDSNTMPTKYNYFTNTAWDSCSSKYVEPEVPVETYTVTYYEEDRKTVYKQDKYSSFNSISYTYKDLTYFFDKWVDEEGNEVSGTLSRDISVYPSGKFIWSICGKILGGSWDNVIPLYYDNDTKSYISDELVLNEGEEFKIRNKESWDGSLGISACDGDKTLVSGSDNAIVSKTGVYVITLSGDRWTISEIVNVVNYTLTYHIEDSEPIVDEVLGGSVFDSKFAEKEGYRLLGWYTDEALENELVKGTTINQDYDLYPKYEAAEDYTAYFYDQNSLYSNTTVYAYAYRDATDGGINADWPGLEVVNHGNGLYSYSIDASKSFDKIIFSATCIEKVENVDKLVVKDQTDNIDLIHNSQVIYNLNTKNSEGKYTTYTTLAVAATSKEGKSAGFYIVPTDNLSLYYDAPYLVTEQKQLAFEKYMSTVSTCDDWAKVEEFVSLAEGLNTEVEIDDKEGKVTIQNKIEFMQTWKSIQNAKEEAPALGPNLLSNITSSNNILIILIVGLLGLTTVGAYYLLNKKKYAK